MRSRNVAILILLLVPLSIFGGIGIQRALSARPQPVAAEGIASDSCAYVEPIRGRFLFNCDRMTPDTAAFCDSSPEDRAATRSELNSRVFGIREAWTRTLRSMRIVDRLESGEMEFTPELAQKTFGAMFAQVGFGGMPKPSSESSPRASITRRGFIETLRCVPHTWASILLSAIPSLTDLDLKELSQTLPDPVALEAKMQERLNFLKAQP